jgi:enoyl-CoA hydratase/carnithine racemase
MVEARGETLDPRGLATARTGADGELLILTLRRPEVLNAIDGALLAALNEAVEAIGADESVRAVVIAGSDRAFCTGLDLKERAGFDDDALRAQRAEIVRLIAGVHQLAVPVVAAVEGPAMAGGFELALACDLIVASETAVFALPEVRVGIFPGGGGTQTLTWLVGPARARDMILTGRRLTAAEAEAWGIAARVVPAGEALGAAVALTSHIAEGAPIGIRQSKTAIRGAHRALADGLRAENALYEDVLASDDRREGFRAFVEKRMPRFTGR